LPLAAYNMVGFRGNQGAGTARFGSS